MARLWDKGTRLNALIEAFTVGEDYKNDARLVGADCAASMAHAQMLGSIGILTADEVAALKRELSLIIRDADAGKFSISRTDEDVHTAIENRLTERIGEPGKKIHTGRSRNDQVIAALRLWSRGFLFVFQDACLSLVDVLARLAEKSSDVPMPGRTHMQTAMPSSVGMWAAAYAEEILDDARLAHGAFEMTDCSPLGSAAGYGTALPLNREMTSELLGFSRVQNNVVYVQNSRGKFESIVMAALEQAGLTLSKMAQELILFSLPEFGYFSLPAELCTGSSIMPQKKNPDGLELIRSRTAAISAYRSAVVMAIRALPSGYNRDFQDTKEPFIRACETALSCVRIMELTVEKLVVNRERLVTAFTPEIFSADRALELAASGVPFRDAYRQVAAELDTLASQDPVEAIRKKTSTGTTGNLRLDAVKGGAQALKRQVEKEQAASAAAFKKLTGAEVVLFRDPLE